MSTVIRVGAPQPFVARGQYFDGETAAAHDVTLTIDEDLGALVMDSGDGAPGLWALDLIREVPGQAGRDLLVLRHRDDPLARLILSDTLLLKRLPNAHRREPTRRRAPLVDWALAAVASVALIIGVLVPTMADQLARFIPPEGERALGETTFGQIRDILSDDALEPVAACDNPDGIAALEAMRTQLTQGRSDDLPLSLYVLDHELINAFALPGGFVVLFRGLIDTAQAPEEVAAVLAHEIGHVVSRDPTRHALRSAGSIGVLGLVFGDFAGGAVILLLAEQLIAAQYSQEAEAAADVFATEMLLNAGVAPSALGDMFQRFLEEYGDSEGVMAHFLSHPELKERIAAARAATPEGFVSQPVISPRDWQALQAICD